MSSLPSAETIFQEALKIASNKDINALHTETFNLLLKYRSEYYERRVDELLSELDLPLDIHEKVKKKLLEPVSANGRTYSNFMEEVSRRVSQAFQPLSGNLAELCVESELIKFGLKKGIHFTRKKEHTDFILYFPDVTSAKTRHRVEVKNVSLRERATRGFAFDGDSLIGFFNQVQEFTRENVNILDQLCKKTGGFCYLPPLTLSKLEYKGERFKPNTEFGSDMAQFVEKGRLP